MRLSATDRQGAFMPTLVMPYPALAQADVRLRRGQTSLWVAASGVGKTQMLANIAHRGGFPTLYWSADTDKHDQTVRALALWTGKQTSEIESMREDPAWADHLTEVLAHSRHIDWVFDSQITTQSVIRHVEAFAEKRGEYPHLIVIDNLSNTVSDLSDEFVEQKTVVTGMQVLARQSRAHIAMLHHAKGEYESGTKPIPKNGVMNNLLKLPEQGITMHKLLGSDALAINVVKNRSGKDDPAAKNPVILNVDFSRATVLGWRAA